MNTETKQQNKNQIGWNSRSETMPDGSEVKGKRKSVRTGGWILFDTLTYFLNNWVLNIAASVITAEDGFKYHYNNAVRDGNRPGEEEKPLLFGPLSRWFHGLTVKSENGLKTLWNWVLPGAGKEVGKGENQDRYYFIRKDAIGITNGVFILSFGGHFTTLIAQLLESPKVKPKIVKWLDRNIADPIKRLFGKEVNEETRAAAYEQLEGKLAGKSIASMWKSRVIGILSVIGAMVTIGAADRAANPYRKEEWSSPDEYRSRIGFRRVSHEAVEWINKRNAAGKDRTLFIKHDKYKDFEYDGMKYHEYMAMMTALETAGTTITSGVQTAVLLGRELFGIGPDTSLGKEDGQPAKSKTKQKPQPKVSVDVREPVQERPVDKTRFKGDYRTVKTEEVARKTPETEEKVDMAQKQGAAVEKPVSAESYKRDYKKVDSAELAKRAMKDPESLKTRKGQSYGQGYKANKHKESAAEVAA
jgi:hypothetical protein